MIFQDKCILVTGGAGTLGSEISKYILGYHPKQLIVLDIAETPLFELEREINLIIPEAIDIKYILGSINDVDLINDTLKKTHIDIIFHTAAYKHVPILENNVAAGIRVNILGTKILVANAIKYNVKNFVFISTDKAVNPINVMGITKSISEKYILGISKNLTHKTKFTVTRFGNIIDSNGSVFQIFKDQIRNGLPLTVTHKKATRYFITISRAVRYLHESLKLDDYNGKLLLFNMGKPKNIYDLAQELIKNSNKINLEIEITGLRPGEKINEELIDDESILLDTKNPNIFIVKGKTDEDFKKINTIINRLELVIKTLDEAKILKELKYICKDYLIRH